MTLTRILPEGYGPGAWHGADMKAAIAGVRAAQAFAHPVPDRHSIAELVLHHAFYVHSVRERLLGRSVEPFVMKGQDWFDLPNAKTMSWPKVQRVLRDMQARLVSVVKRVDAGKTASPLTEIQRAELVLGITCHAVYHAGQVQLLKALLNRRQL